MQTKETKSKKSWGALCLNTTNVFFCIVPDDENVILLSEAASCR